MIHSLEKKKGAIGARVLICVLIFLLAQGIVAPVNQTLAQDDIEELEEEAVSNAVTAIGPSLIRFETIGGLSKVDEVVVSQSPATGTVVSKDGYVVSASFHFAHKPASIFATFGDGKKASAQIVGRDPTRKIVLLKINSDQEFTVPEFKQRNEVRVGETVIGVGRVMDAQFPNVTTGIVSATHRVWGRAIQTDAKISPANFGGPLLALDGRVTGILVPMSPDDEAEMAGTQWYDSGIGFAVPITDVMNRFEDLKQGKTIRRGLLGISLKGSDTYADPAEVAFCQGDSPAGLAGVKQGDRIVEINGAPISRHSQVKHAVGPLYEGDVVTVKVDRAGDPFEFEFKLAGEIAKFIPPGIGMLARNDDQSGVVVTHVFEGRPAERAGIAVGDRLLELNEKGIENVEALKESLIQIPIGAVAKLKVVSKNEPREVSLEVGKLTAGIERLTLDHKIQNSKAIDIKVPDMGNQCMAIVPEAEDGPAPGLLVWIPAPGKLQKKVQLEIWKRHCERHNVVVMIPQSKDEKKWSPADGDFIVAAVEVLRKIEDVDSERIAVGGEKTGGTMAGLIAFQQRKLFRGLILLQAGLSKRSQSVVTSPIEPLLILVGLNGGETKSITDTIERLEDESFPIGVEKGLGKLKNCAGDLLLWVQGLDRL